MNLDKSLDLQLFRELAKLTPVLHGEHLSPELIDGYVANCLDEQTERLVDNHLGVCVECLRLAEARVEARSAGMTALQRSADILNVLSSCGAIQQGFDYVMPSGVHVDTHVNLGTACSYDHVVDALVSAFDSLLAHRSFDVVLSHGWPMAHIARRLVWRYRSRVKLIIESEGYDPPVLNRAVPSGATVAILTDVTLSARLLKQLTKAVKDAEARVAAMVTVVDARESSDAEQAALLSLCELRIGRTNSKIGQEAVLERRDFNPCSYNLTVRKKEARSPFQLFDSDESVAAMWARVFVAGAYEHHHVEGSSHYNGFIDTERLLEHPLTGEAIVNDLAKLLVSESKKAPTHLLVPRRHRGRLVGMRLTESLYDLTGVLPAVIPARMRGGRAQLSERDRSSLRGQEVVVCDSAAGHGATLDALCELARIAGCSRVSVAIVVSRLKESCEEAFKARLQGRFWRLYYFPTPAFMVSRLDPIACPYCAMKDSVIKAAERLGVAAIESLAESFCKHAGDRSQRYVTQPRTIPDSAEDFLKRCERRMAGGVTLHALCTAMNDGMAPLNLPEILDQAIPPGKRAAMLESLPAGSLKWSGASLEHSVRECLGGESPHQVWLAAANLLARAGRSEWIDYLGPQLKRRSSDRLPKHFWGWLAFDTASLVMAHPEKRPDIQRKLQSVFQSSSLPVRAGVGQMLEALEKSLII